MEKENSQDKEKLILHEVSINAPRIEAVSGAEECHPKEQDSIEFEETHLEEYEEGGHEAESHLWIVTAGFWAECSSVEGDHDLTDADYKPKHEPDRTYLSQEDHQASDGQEYQFSQEANSVQDYHGISAEETADPLQSQSSGLNRAFEFPPSSHKACQTQGGESFSLR